MGIFKSTFPWIWAIVASRNARRGWLTIFMLIVVTLCAIEVRAWVFRFQARRLLNEVRALEMGKTPAAQALRLRERWPDTGEFWLSQMNQRPCTAEKCRFYVVITEWNWIAKRGLYDDRGWWATLQPVVRTLEHFGLRWSQAVGEVEIRHGLVTGVGAAVRTATRDGRWHMMLIADATPRANLFAHSAPDEHPNLHIRYQGPPDHGGCKPFCRATVAEYTDQLSHDLFLRVTDFELFCLTSFRLCKDFGDMMPQVKRMVDHEEAEREAESRNMTIPPCTVRTVETLGRDVPAIALMRVKRVGKGRPAAMVEYDGVQMPDTGEQAVEYELVKKLKWRSNEVVRTRVTHPLWFSGAMVDPKTHLLSREWFQPGREMIVFFDHFFTSCDSVPATEAYMQALQAGIAQDRTEESK